MYIYIYIYVHICVFLHRLYVYADITLRSIWQFFNYWVPLRVSHFKFKYVDDADDKQATICNPSTGHTELKKRWKKAARW